MYYTACALSDTVYLVEEGGSALSTTVRNRRVKQDGAIRYRDRLTKNDLLEIYRRLWFARVFDETLYDLSLIHI